MSGRPDLRLYLGKSFSGKTTLAMAHAAGASRVLIHDPNCEKSQAKAAVVCRDAGSLVNAVRSHAPFRVCWRGVETMGAAAFEFANKVAWAATDLLVIWDEVDRFLDAGRLPPWAYKMVNAGRHRGVRVFACSRRPFRVSRDLTANATRIVAFRITEPDDVDYLRKTMGQAARQLSGLAEYRALDWTEAGAEVKKSPFP